MSVILGCGHVDQVCAGCDGPPTPVSSITIAPATAVIQAGQTQQFVAIAKTAEDNQIVGVTFDWASSNEGVATVNNKGLVTAMSEGTTNITAASHGVTSKEAALDVTLAGNRSPIASITIFPSEIQVVFGRTQPFAAVAQDASGKQISGVTFDWTSSNMGVATIDNNGLATANYIQGTTSITASSGGVTSNPATLTVDPSAI